MTPSEVERSAAKLASSAALRNSRRLLRAARLLYPEGDSQALATSLLTLAHEELGKALFLRVVAENGADLDLRSTATGGRRLRRITDNHETKFALSVGLIIHDELELMLFEVFEGLMSRPLTVAEQRIIGIGLVGGHLLDDMAPGGTLYTLLAPLSISRRQALSELVEQLIDWVRLEYDGLSDSKLRGLYVDIDGRSMEVLSPESTDPPQFTLLASRLEKALERLEATPMSSGGLSG